MKLNGVRVRAARRGNDRDVLGSTTAYSAADSAKATAHADDTGAAKQDAEDRNECSGSEKSVHVPCAGTAYQSEKNEKRAFECSHPLTCERDSLNRLFLSTLWEALPLVFSLTITQ